MSKETPPSSAEADARARPLRETLPGLASGFAVVFGALAEAAAKPWPELESETYGEGKTKPVT